MFGVPSERTAHYAVYHDESGTDRAHERYLLQGALFVPQSSSERIVSSLRLSRGGYTGRIHFVDLRDRTSSQRGIAAWQWINLYFSELSYQCPYKCMVADTRSKSPQITRFEQPHHLYNYTTVLALYGGLAWSLTAYDKVGLQIYSERADRAAADNFVTYVPRELAARANRRRSPASKTPLLEEPIDPVHLVTGDPDCVDPRDAPHCELLQLADLLTSGVSQAVNASASQEIKLQIGDFIAGWVEDTRLPPWSQALDLHRRFSVSAYPDGAGGFYDIPLSIRSIPQPTLFDLNDV